MASKPKVPSNFVQRVLIALLLTVIIAFGLGGYQVIFGKDEFLRVVHTVEKHKNSPDAAKRLKGLNINAKSHESHGSTALIWFSRMGDVKAIEMLLSAGANRAAVNSLGRTAADEAQANGNLAVYQLLVSRRASDLSR